MFATETVPGQAGDVPLEVLAAQLVQGWAEQTAHLAAWLAKVAEFDRREGWGEAGVLSCAHWLSWRCGIDSRTAREHVRVARTLEGLGQVRDLFARGRLSYSKVRALCRVANADNEELLVGLAADLSASQLERTVAAYARAHGRPLSLADDAERRVRCGVTRWVDGDGLVHHEIVSSPEDALVIDRAMELGGDRLYAAAKEAAKAEPDPGEGGSGEGSSGEGGSGEGSSGEGGSGGAGGAGRAQRRSGPAGRLEGLVWAVRRGLANPCAMVDEPYLILIHVRQGQALVGDDGRVDLGNGLVVAPRTLARLGCSSMIQAVVDGDDGRPLDLGRRVRVATAKQKLALAATHDTCAFPGCEIPLRWCEFHHLRPWIQGGESNVDNYRPLCRRHHHLCHEGGWSLVVDHRDQVVALPPGPGQPRHHGMALAERDIDPDELVEANRAAGVVASEWADALSGTYAGEIMDRWALDNIVHAMAEASGHGRPTEVDSRITRGSLASPN